MQQKKEILGYLTEARRMLMRVGLELVAVRTYRDDDAVDIAYPTPLS
jgi:hypothetical protein